jgi:hypothetical protein
MRELEKAHVTGTSEEDRGNNREPVLEETIVKHFPELPKSHMIDYEINPYLDTSW